MPDTPPLRHRTPSLARLPPLTSLRAFVVAARHLNFARAAEQLHVTPAAVGQQIRQLEDHLGCDLFRRTGRQLELTEAGEMLLPGLTDAFEGMIDSIARVTAPAGPGVLKLSVAPSFAAKWLVPRLDDFQARHPDITVSIDASIGLVDFAGNDFDCAVRYGPGAYAGLVVEKFLPEEVFPVCSPRLLLGDTPLDRPENLAFHTLLHDEDEKHDPSCPDWRMWLSAAGIADVDAGQGPRFRQSALVLEAAIAGQGVALAKARLADADLRAGRLVRPFGTAQRVAFSYFFVAPPHKTRLDRVRAFRDWLLGRGAEVEPLQP